MPKELKNARITHVSYVDKGANQKSFFITKSVNKDKQPTFEKTVSLFTKSEDERQLVYGVVYEPDTYDSDEDFMTAVEIEKAAHFFMKEARHIDKQHDFESGVGEVVESYIAPADFSIDDVEIKKGSWVLATKASDEIWEQIKSGEITGYSMAGLAESIEKQAEPALPEKNGVEAFFNVMKSFFVKDSVVEKGMVRESYQQNQGRRNLWAVWEAITDEFHESVWENRTPDVADFERILSATQDFVLILQEIKTPEAVQKAMADKPKGDDDMNLEDIKKAFKEEIKPLSDRLEQLEKANAEADGDENQDDNQTEGNNAEDNEVLKSVRSLLKQELSPLNDRLGKIEKSRGVSNQNDDNGVPVQKEDKHYLSGYL